MGEARCNWVRDRLPLLAGAELFGAERRGVERHLIECASCRAHRAGHEKALEALHAAAAASPVAADAPSLWPALARQIRETRRPVAATPWWAPLAPAWPRIGLAAGLLVALGVTAAAWRQTASSHAQIADAAQPLPPLPIPPAPAPLAPNPARVAVAEPVDEPAPRAGLEHQLERGTPMGPDGADSKSRPTY
jgi:hypothetical protein